jgi:hypothetical protein
MHLGITVIWLLLSHTLQTRAEHDIHHMVNTSPLKVDQLAHAFGDHSDLVVAELQPANTSS